MRKIILLAVALCGLIGFQSCGLDNYNEPSASLTGALVDSETNENVPCQYQNGSRIRIYEFYNNNWSKQPNDFYTRQDGTFTNTAVFPGKYRIEAEGAFETPAPVEMEIANTAALQLKVVPFLRVAGTATADGTSIKMTATVKRSASTRAIKAIEFYAGLTPYVDKSTHNKKVVLDISGMTEQQILTSALQGTIEGLQKGKTYYCRVGVLGENAGNFYNYSTITEVKIP